MLPQAVAGFRIQDRRHLAEDHQAWQDWIWDRLYPPLEQRAVPDRHARQSEDIQVCHPASPVSREYSRKPEEAYPAAELLMPDARRLELFSRTNRPGWDHFGNEAGKFGEAA